MSRAKPPVGPLRILLKWLGLGLGGLLAAAAAAVLAIYLIVGTRLSRTYEVEPYPISVPQSVPQEATGWPLILTDFCRECHGEDLGGQILEDDFLAGRLVASNLTAGEGGVGATFSDQDYIRAIRHGVGPEGRPLMVMPSYALSQLSDADVATIVAYIRQQPPVDRRLPPTTVGPLTRIFLFLGMLEHAISAEEIDHEGLSPPAPTPGVTVEYGRYLSLPCRVCHGEDYSGGPGAGEGLNLTPGGNLPGWTEEDFITAMRTGERPEGEPLDREEMPWEILGKMTDDELRAIWLFLQTLPAVESTPTPAP